MQEEQIRSFQNKFVAIKEEVKKGIIGQDDMIENVLIGIIAGGNILLEGTPGLGKTQLVKDLAKTLELSFSRIQFTPDLMPVDIIGTVMINKSKDNLDLSFQKGPIFNSLVLADEINRATPKTQSAMLEAMQEKTVTVGNTTYNLPEPFFVLATQNPLEMEGTYPLPEAQLDRFMFKLKINLPKIEDISKIVYLTNSGYSRPEVNKQISGKDIIEMRDIAYSIPLAKEVGDYAVKIMMNTHPEHTELEIIKKYVTCGASIRGVQSIINGAKVKAMSKGRYNVSREDIRDMALISLRHRVFLNFKAMADKIDSDYIIEELIKQVK